jgi:two-component system response regulator NreC
MAKMRVLVVDDQEIVRQGIIALLEGHDVVEVVGEASDGREAIAQAKEVRPDVVLMDISMPRMDGIEASRHIHESHPEIRILMLTVHKDDEKVLSSFKAGAAGYLPKGGTVSELVSAIESVYCGDYFVHPSVAKAFTDGSWLQSGDDPYDRLTEREREVLKLTTSGWTNREIANSMQIGLNTVATLRTRIMGKLRINNRFDLVKYAVRKGIISIDT